MEKTMTEKTDGAAASLEDLFSEGEGSDTFENEIMKSKAELIAAKFVPVAMQLKQQLEKARKDKDTAALQMETREMSVTMPKAAWDGIALIAEMFNIFEEHQDNPGIPQGILEAVERNKELYVLVFPREF
jgi:hypothetical protein